MKSINLFLLVSILLQCTKLIQTQVDTCNARNCLPTSCADILVSGSATSGTYTVYPKQWFGKSNISVYCDMETDGGGWIVIQRRGDYEVQQNFVQNWTAYRKGFGHLERDFWLGNGNINILSNQEYVALRIDMEDVDGVKVFALYNQFRVSGCQDRYRLHLDHYSGTAEENMSYHNNMTFVTFDDGDVHKCAASNKGGWWYNECNWANLNGLYGKESGGTDMISWSGFTGVYGLKSVEMKIRPSHFSLKDF